MTEDDIEVFGQITGGEHGRIIIRQKSDQVIELGDLLMGKTLESRVLLQVYNLLYGCQIDDKTIQMMSGMHLEGFSGSSRFLEKDLRSYVLAEVKALVVLPNDGGPPRTPKVLPTFFSEISLVSRDDLAFIETPECPVFIGNVRSGSKVLDVAVHLNGVDMFTHHVLIPATTGRGKSNLVKVMLWSTIGRREVGVLVLDPHDEYYGRSGPGLRHHPEAADGLVYYSPDPPKGGQSLRINLRLVHPGDLSGIVFLTDAQKECVWTLYRRSRDRWLEALFTEMTDEEMERLKVSPATVAVLQRRFSLVFDLRVADGSIYSRNEVFTTSGGLKFLDDVMSHLEGGRKVIIDTSRLDHQAELLVGSLVANRVYHTYREHKGGHRLRDCPVITFIVEEAPRVLGGEERNIFGTIAREGRKFKIGITAITQLCSLIPREILANLNTKIILGNEMDQERKAIIASASQDLSADNKLLGALDKGEALVSSVFTKFAIPVQVPLFDDIVARECRGGGKGKGKDGAGKERVRLVGL